MVQIELKYFGMIAEHTGKAGERMEIRAGTGISGLIAILEEQYPGLGQLAFSVAINRSLVQDDEPLRDGMEVALLPPFAGG